MDRNFLNLVFIDEIYKFENIESFSGYLSNDILSYLENNYIFGGCGLSFVDNFNGDILRILTKIERTTTLSTLKSVLAMNKSVIYEYSYNQGKVEIDMVVDDIIFSFYKYC